MNGEESAGTRRVPGKSDDGLEDVMTMANTTRRDFVVGAAGAAAVGLAGSTLALAEEAGSAQKSGRFVDTVDWNAVYDVVVIGYGAAGAVVAITAADAGAQVLLVDKAPYGAEGGDSKFSGQCVMGVEPEHIEDLKTYFIAMCGNYIDYDDECFQVMAEGCADNFDFLVSLGADGDKMRQNEGEEGFRSPGSGYVWNENPNLEGSGYNKVWAVNANETVDSLYYLLQDAVDARDAITVWHEAPAKDLIQDPNSKVVAGVVIEKDGKTVNVLARNGVVMALGGYENNQKMIGSYLQRSYCYPCAGKYNDGDGVKMAIKVGADLWHMSNSAGFLWGYEMEANKTALYISAYRMKNGIVVGPSGERFYNESASSRHGRINIGGSSIQMPTPDPSWFIIDSDAVQNGSFQIAFGLTAPMCIDKGYLVEAQTIADVAEGIGCDSEVLQKTVDDYNDAYDAGVDAQYGRPFDSMVPVRTAPFYYMRLVPTMYNSQGGARRNARAEVVDPDGNPIPHLYSAGDFGAIWPDMYNGSGNLGECLVFGRIAGTNATEGKDDLLANGEDVEVNDLGIVDKEPTFEVGENEYIGCARSKGGPLWVKVTMDGDKIADVMVVRSNETLGLADDAFTIVPAAIIEKQSTQVDAVSGATRTSEGIMAAVEDALSKVKK